jgi:hypothetical protein
VVEVSGFGVCAEWHPLIVGSGARGHERREKIRSCKRTISVDTAAGRKDADVRMLINQYACLTLIIRVPLIVLPVLLPKLSYVNEAQSPVLLIAVN